MPWARMLADLIVVFHTAYVSFVIFGLAAILIGAAFHWGWVRNFWFRAIHLTTIGIVVAEAIAGISCPLTDWENQFRVAAGQAGYPGDFIGYWAHRLIFFQAKPWVISMLQILFGLAVLATFVLAPPRRPRRSRHEAPTDPLGLETARSG